MTRFEDFKSFTVIYAVKQVVLLGSELLSLFILPKKIAVHTKIK